MIKPLKIFLAVVVLLYSHLLLAQCSLTDNSNVKLTGVSATAVTCPQNGTITVSGVTGGGGNYSFELVDGSIIRGIQSQPVFAALLPGRYKVRVTGCNGTFTEVDSVIVPNNYLEPPLHTIRIVGNESFKCNATNTGRIVIAVNYFLPTNQWSDTLLYKQPFQYQITTNPDPLNGFNNVPFSDFEYATYYSYNNNFDRGGTGTSLPPTDAGSETYRSLTKFDTLYNLVAGTTYYIRVTDQCGVFKTNSITMPAVTSPVFNYSFQVREPYILNSWSTDMPAMKAACIQWGELTVTQNGSPVSSILSSNTFFPVTAVLKRQDDGSVINTRTYQAGSLQKFSSYGFNSTNINNLIFDSVPRVPVTLELTDQCGTKTILQANNPSTRTQFKLQAFTRCLNAGSYFYVNTFQAAPSLPVRFKIYDASNTLLHNKLMTINYQYVFLDGFLPPNSMYTQMNQSVTVPSFGQYRLVYEDQCGMRDSMIFNFQAGAAAPAPAFNFRPYNPVCAVGNGSMLYSVEVLQTVTSPVSKIEIVSGSASISYPRLVKNSSFVNFSGNAGISYTPTRFFDSLPAGSYNVRVEYGCNQVLNTSFSFNTGAGNSLTGTLAFTVQPNACSSIGSSVRGEARITSTDVNFVRTDTPCIRIMDAPIAFLQKISRSRNGALPTLPFDMGAVGASSVGANGIDTNVANIFPIFTFMSINGGWFSYNPGNYTFQLYGKCSGRILDTKGFSVTDAAYSTPNLGASSGYICDAGNPKVVVNPVGGRRNFSYQIKLASSPGETGYSALQSDSVFTLPSTTPPGTVYTVRAIDACNNSFVGNVVVNSFTGQLFIASTNDCVGRPARIFTGFIPGATYTWTRPNGTTLISNSNEINIPELQVHDIGQYTVMVNALNGCISRGAGYVIGNRCYSVLPIRFTSFMAQKVNQNLVTVKWSIAEATNVAHYVVERSTDGSNWAPVHQQATQAGGATQSYSFNDNLPNHSHTILYYRIRSVGRDAKENFSPVKNVLFSKQFEVNRLFPNPFKDAVSLDVVSESEGKAVLLMYDMQGREVSRGTLPVQKGINHLQYKPVLVIPPGQYTLIIHQGSNSSVHKLVKIP